MRHSKHRVQNYILIGLACVVFFVPSVRNSLADIFFKGARPLLLWGAKGGNSIRSFGDYFHSYATLLSENERFKEENKAILSLHAELESEKRKNSELSKNLRSTSETPQSLVESSVLSSFSDPSGVTLIIAGGKDKGIVSGSFVVTGSRAVIGRVSSVYESVSSVSLIRNTGTALSVFLMPQRIEGLFLGKGDDMVIDLIPNTAAVENGNLILTSSAGENAVSNLLIGEVVSVQKSDVKAFQEIHIKESSSYRMLDTVFVITRR